MRVFDAGTREGPEVVSDRILTLPNVLSLLRLGVLPVVFLDLMSGRLTRALVIAVIFGATDWLDGYVARRTGQVSRLGQILDPIADRALVVVVGVGFLLVEVVPTWAILTLFARDGLVVLVGGTMLAAGRRPPPVTRTGKLATFLVMWSLAFFLLAAIVGGGVHDPHAGVRGLAWATWVPGTVLYYAAGIQYAAAMTGRRGGADPDPA